MTISYDESMKNKRLEEFIEDGKLKRGERTGDDLEVSPRHDR